MHQGLRGQEQGRGHGGTVSVREDQRGSVWYVNKNNNVKVITVSITMAITGVNSSLLSIEILYNASQKQLKK